MANTTYANEALPYDGQQNAMTEITSLFQKTDQRLNRHARLTGTLGTDYTLTAEDMRCGVLELAWALTANVVVKIPVTGHASGTRRTLFIYNHTSGAFTITIKTTALGPISVQILQGYNQEVWHDDTNVYPKSAALLATQSTLNTTLTAFWRLEEASGTRNDSFSTNHLTDNNTVTQAVGKIGSAGQFTSANSEYLSIADNAALSVADIDFSFSAWVYFDTLATTIILSKYNGGGAVGTRAYRLWYDNTASRFKWSVTADGTTVVDVTANNFGAPVISTWYHIVCWHDSVANTINIKVNNGTTNSTAHTTGVQNDTSEFRIGAQADGAYWNGRIDAVGMWKKVLTAAEITELYNLGVGREYPF